MSPLRQALADYLAVRRSLGYKLAYPEHLLGQFIAYLEDASAGTVTTAHALGWATLPGGDAWWHAQRLSMARGFAQYLHTIDPAAEVPPAGLIPARAPRATPYLYSAGDITALIAAAGSLRSPLRAATYQTLIGLLTVTGMRRGEAIALDDEDFDARRGLLLVRHAQAKPRKEWDGEDRVRPLSPHGFRQADGLIAIMDNFAPRSRILSSPSLR